MQQETKRTFRYDAENEKFRLRIESEGPIKFQEKDFGVSHEVTEQIWDIEGVKTLQGVLVAQKAQLTNAMEDNKKKLKELGKFSEREIQKIEAFKVQIDRAKKYEQKKQIDDQIISQENSMGKVTKDLEELNEGLKQLDELNKSK